MQFDEASIGALEGILADAAKAEIMPRFRKLESSDVRQKSSAIDLVTEADVRAERAITAALREHWPDALVVGEEAYAENPAVLDGLGEAELAFVIDPVDGTFNFASGIPVFGVILAVVSRGETVAGLIHDPVGNDTMAAVKGGGAWLRHNDGGQTRVKAAEPVPFGQMTGGVGWGHFSGAERLLVARNQAKSLSSFNFRCAAHEYRLIAAGHAHFLLYNSLNPWDHLAGVLIHAEAGGYAARFDGSPYLPVHRSGGILSAPDRDSWEEIRRELWAEE